MAYSTPLTAVSNATLTAAQWNASVRDNILVTPAALATTAGQLFVSTAANAIAVRTPSAGVQTGSSTTTSLTYTDLIAGADPVASSVTTGASALVIYEARMSNSSAGAECWASYTISGATSSAAGDSNALHFSVNATGSARMCSFQLATGLTPGSNTFTMKYRVSAGTGTFSLRSIFVLPF